MDVSKLRIEPFDRPVTSGPPVPSDELTATAAAVSGLRPTITAPAFTAGPSIGTALAVPAESLVSGPPTLTLQPPPPSGWRAAELAPRAEPAAPIPTTVRPATVTAGSGAAPEPARRSIRRAAHRVRALPGGRHAARPGQRGAHR